MTTRHVALSLFPDLRPERPIGPILPSVISGSNAALIRAIAPYYLTGSVCDLTYGEGGWWTEYRPPGLVGHDKYKGDGVDFTALPEADGTYDTACFDPPYVPQGGYDTSTAQAFANQYGLRSVSRLDQRAENALGLAEAARVVRRGGVVLMKCNDFVNGGGFHLGHIWAIERADALGLTVHDLIIHHSGSGPGGHNIFTPIRARRHHSYLLVFKVPAR